MSVHVNLENRQQKVGEKMDVKQFNQLQAHISY